MAIVTADFVPVPLPPSAVVLVPRAAVMAGRVRLLSQLRADALDAGEMVDRGVHACPCEIDVDLTRLFRDAGPSYAFDFFFEPTEDVEPKIDIELHRSPGGRTWHAERLLSDCRPGVVQTTPIRLASEKKLRLRMRFTAPGAVHVWLREARRGSELREQLEETAHG